MARKTQTRNSSQSPSKYKPSNRVPAAEGNYSGSHTARAESSAPSSSRYALFTRLRPAVITLFAAALNIELWINLVQGVKPRAWDGTGHFALAQIYQSIFPGTFGWTNAYFAGMPFPNFYPPLFYWCVALLHHTHLFSFSTAFKLALALPILLLPFAIWMLTKAVSDNNRSVATGAALASVLLLTDIRFEQFGLSYPSTFLVGLYTQPLGFVLLVIWYITYINSSRHIWRIALASLLLALTVLANFFNAATCVFFIAATIVNDIKGGSREGSKQPSPQARKDLLAHIISPLVALLLTLFWLIPVLSDYEYFVTRPQTLPLKQILSVPNLIWYTFAIIGVLRWVRHPSKAMRPFLWACFALACGVVLATVISPRWFPFQAPRFIATLNFLLVVPIGQCVAAAFVMPAILFGPAGLWPQLKVWLLRTMRPGHKKKKGFNTYLRNWLLGKGDTGFRPSKFFSSLYVKAASAIALLMLILFLLERPSYDIAFYSTSSQQPILDVLRFAEQHREGRYLVEVPVASSSEAAFNGRALNSYLGAQGNETLSVVFREASPNSIFFNAAVNGLSAYPDTFGISSVLAEDLDFRDQPLAKHLERARLIGTKYLVIFTPWMKGHIVEEKGIKAVFEAGDWTVFELVGEPLPHMRVLQYKPALVVSNFSLKQRKQNEYDFIRFAEEQFTDGWFDVLLVRSPETKIDRVQNLEQFGALILDTYDYEDENAAFERLQNFAQRQALVLLSSDAQLFQRIRASIGSFPFAEIVERPVEDPGKWLEALTPTIRYQSSSIRKTWSAVRRALDTRKQAVNTQATSFESEINQNRISIRVEPPPEADPLPVVIDTTYFPAWHRDDGQAIYAATPFFMLTFIREPVEIVYARRGVDRVSLLISAGTLLLLCGFTGFHYRKQVIRFVTVNAHLPLTRH